MKSENETRSLHQLPATELNDMLSRFVLAVRKKNGEEYEPSSLRDMLSSVQRHLNKHNYGLSVIDGIQFNGLRGALKSKQMDLKSQGKGNRTNKAEALTDEEVAKLYETGQLGLSSPGSLLNSLWFYNCVYFGLRGGKEEHRRVTWGDITLKVDNSGQEFIEYNERQTKTRTGENIRNIREKCPRAWSNPDDSNKCPVAAFKLFKEKRPMNYSTSTDPYYIAPVTNDTNPDLTERWFLRQPVGVNKLSSLMTNMAKNAGLDTHKKLTNHSARKYLVQTLRDQNVAPTSIMQVTGHKNVNSITNYSCLSEENQHYISDLLSHRNPAPRPAILPAAPPALVQRLALPAPPLRLLASTAPPASPHPAPPAPSTSHNMPDMSPQSTYIPGGSAPGPYTAPPQIDTIISSQTMSSSDNRLFQNCYIGKLIINNYRQPDSRPRKRRAVISDSDDSQSQ